MVLRSTARPLIHFRPHPPAYTHIRQGACHAHDKECECVIVIQTQQTAHWRHASARTYTRADARAHTATQIRTNTSTGSLTHASITRCRMRIEEWCVQKELRKALYSKFSLPACVCVCVCVCVRVRARTRACTHAPFMHACMAAQGCTQRMHAQCTQAQSEPRPRQDTLGTVHGRQCEKDRPVCGVVE